jgi:hypothetical protein
MNIVKNIRGEVFKQGDRVYAFDLDSTKVYGILYENDHKEVSEWYVKYDDGAECAVLDFDVLWKHN